MKQLSILLVVGMAICLIPSMTGCANPARQALLHRNPVRPHIDIDKQTFTDGKGIVHHPSPQTIEAIKKLNELSDKQRAQAPK
jgi:hypothetical protein